MFHKWPLLNFLTNLYAYACRIYNNHHVRSHEFLDVHRPSDDTSDSLYILSNPTLGVYSEARQSPSCVLCVL
jgi:hypothetical protein